MGGGGNVIHNLISFCYLDIEGEDGPRSGV